jgi:osmoprotectant transport system substrate-binding protein
VKRRKLFALLSLFACILALASCGEEENGEEGGRGVTAAAIRHDAANAGTTIRVGSKNFTEQIVLGELYAQGLEAAGFEVTRQLDLGNEHDAQQALEENRIDGYPEYTGTALGSLCAVPAEDIPKDPAEAFEDARGCLARDGLVAFPPTPFTSSNEVGVTQQVAEAHDLQQISDLARVDEEFTLYGPKECRQRTDCLLGLRRVYGLKFKEFAPVEVDQRHEVLGRGDKVASIVFTTDPQNRRDQLVLLEDDRGMFPPNNSTFVVREEVARRAGDDLRRVVELLQRGLTDEVMQELNARVDLDGDDPADVAVAYLRQAGLVARSEDEEHE